MLTLKCSSNNGDDFSQKLINTANRILELRGQPKIENETFLKIYLLLLSLLPFSLGICKYISTIQAWYSPKSSPDVTYPLKKRSDGAFVSSSLKGAEIEKYLSLLSSKENGIETLRHLLLPSLPYIICILFIFYSLSNFVLRQFFFVGLLIFLVFHMFWSFVEFLYSYLQVPNQEIFLIFFSWPMSIFFLTISPLILYFFINTSFIKYILTHLGSILFFLMFFPTFLIGMVAVVLILLLIVSVPEMTIPIETELGTNN